MVGDADGRASGAVPLWVWLDPTRRCNLQCELCYTKHSHANVDMSPDVLQVILERLLSETSFEVRVAHLNWRGEPLMNTDFVQLLQIACARFELGRLHWHTNGSLLKASTAEAICKTTNPHLVYVSIDGGNRASHDRHRGRGTFQSALRGARLLMDARNRSGSGHRIGIYQLDFGVPEREYDPEFLELAESADEWVRVAPLDVDGSTLTLRTRSTLAQRADLGPCFWAGNALCIDPEGGAHVCLLSKGGEARVGDLLREPIATVVERARTFRQRLLENGRASVAHCRACRKPAGDAHATPHGPPLVHRRLA